MDDPEECYHLFRNHFLVSPGFDFAYVPSYWKWWDATAHQDVYRMHKRQLQALQWLNPKQHWVLKCPNHLSGLKYLLETYPDARIVYTHRSPEKTVPSLASLAAVTWCMTSDTVDLKNVGEFALDLAERCEAAGQAAMQLVPPAQLAQVGYDELVRDPAGMAAQLYERFGYPPDAGFKARAQQWLADHPSDKHGKHAYALEDFGLTPQMLKQRLAAPPLRSASGG
ncbi:MAG: sulfotransferase [Hyphomicrobium sp.]